MSQKSHADSHTLLYVADAILPHAPNIPAIVAVSFHSGDFKYSMYEMGANHCIRLCSSNCDLFCMISSGISNNELIPIFHKRHNIPHLPHNKKSTVN